MGLSLINSSGATGAGIIQEQSDGSTGPTVGPHQNVFDYDFSVSGDLVFSGEYALATQSTMSFSGPYEPFSSFPSALIFIPLGTVTGPASGTGDFSYELTETDWQAAGGLTELHFIAIGVPNPGQVYDWDQIVINLSCFGEGTRIAVPGGEQNVEQLGVGDSILTQNDTTILVRWLGHQTVKLNICNAERLAPVRIRAGAMGHGLPHTDLIVTADHGMIVDGLVINASALVNGDTIDFVPMAELEDSFTVYHVETENHDVILANGAPAETFIDYVGRKGFDNYAEYVELYGAERIIPEMDRPRISTRRLLPEGIRARLGLANGSDSDRDIALTA